MRICIGGKNNIAVDVCKYIQEYYPQIGISAIPTKGDDGQDGFQRSFKKYAEENGVEIVSLKDVYDWEDLIFLSTEFDRIIRPDRFKSKELFNIHFSKLPKYKGCHTAAMPILNGEKFTGVTFHLIEAGIDTGDIIDQRDLLIESNDTCGSLYLKLIKLGTDVVIANLESVFNHSYKAYPQPTDDTTYYPRTDIDYANCLIDYNRTSLQIDRQIRAFSFRAYQQPKFNKIPITSTKITCEKSTEKPGTLVSEDNYSIRIATIDYDVVLYKEKMDNILEYVKKGNLKELKQVNNLSDYIHEHEAAHGWTMLMVAAYYAQYDVARYLLSLGSDINARNYKGTTVIMYAKDGMIKTTDDKLFHYLLEQGANPFLKDYSGKNLFEYIGDELKCKLIGIK
jgi:methionyl-tRNA formyltransferase